MCAQNIVFPFIGFGWRTGDEVGTFVLGLLAVSWVGLGVHGIRVHALRLTVPPSSPALYLGVAQLEGGAV